LATLKVIDVIAFNSEAERRFVALLQEMQGWDVRRVRAEAAFRLNISPETAKRYLEKWTAPSAPFALVEGRLTRKE
jgi:hypothetical protein